LDYVSALKLTLHWIASSFKIDAAFDSFQRGGAAPDIIKVKNLDFQCGCTFIAQSSKLD
jgi:hypothetical protein